MEDISPSEVGSNLCSTRPTLVPFLEQPWGDSREMGQSMYEPSAVIPPQAETEHLRLKP